MKTDSNKPKLAENDELKDLFQMQTSVALVESMLRSKTLTVMVITGLLLFGGFFLFLFKIAG